jgi:hypothetical protein
MSESDATVNQVSRANGVSLRSAAETCPPALAAEQSASGLIELLRRIFSFPAMLGAVLVGAVYLFARAFIVDPDCWWHIKTGELILATHQFPHSDPYSFTVAGQPWLAFEWGGDVLLGLAWRWGGLRGLDLLLMLVAGAILIALYYLATLCAGNSKAGFVTAAILYLLAIPSISLRPQMLGYLFLVVTLIVLERFRRGMRGAIWLLPLLFLIWVNTHASWIIGLSVLALYWLAGQFEWHAGGVELVRWSRPDSVRLLLVMLLSICALPITPYGTELCAFPFQVASGFPISHSIIREWQPMPFDLAGGKLFLAVVLGFIIAQIIFRFVWRVETLVLFLGGTAMATLHVRFLLLFVPFFAPVLAVILARWVSPYNRAKDQPVVNAVLMVAIAAVMIHYFPSRGELEDRVAENFPVGAVEYLNAHDVPEPMLNSYRFGGYLAWARGPEHKIFIDGRSELYETGGLLNDHMQVLDGKPAALSVLRFYGIRSLILEHSEPLVSLVSVLPDWQKVYSDNRSVIFVRREAAAVTTAPEISRPTGRD